MFARNLHPVRKENRKKEKHSAQSAELLHLEWIFRSDWQLGISILQPLICFFSLREGICPRDQYDVSSQKKVNILSRHNFPMLPYRAAELKFKLNILNDLPKSVEIREVTDQESAFEHISFNGWWIYVRVRFSCLFRRKWRAASETGSFHLAIRLDLVSSVGIASLTFSRWSKPRRARSFVLLPQIRRALDSLPQINRCFECHPTLLFGPPAHYLHFQFDRWTPCHCVYTAHDARGFL